MSSVDYKDLKYICSYNANDFLDCHFTDPNGSDPEGVDDFIRHKAQLYQDNNLCVVYTVRYEGKVCGYFTLSMTSIKVDKLPKIDKFEWASTISYPAILLGNMGVDNKFWKRGIGSRICNYCVGLAAEESEKIGCRYIILHTKTRETFYKKLGFVTSGDRNKNGTITMYKRLTYKRALFEYVSLKENVSIKVTRAADLNKNQHSNNKT